jgi:RimJ/RimL family protein N-acetyltransferase
MIIKLCSLNEIDKIMEIYDSARNFMRANGNFNQWINGYPSKELIVEDIKSDRFYGVYLEGELVGVFMLAAFEDPTYKTIYDGAWLNKEKYAVIHRIGTILHGKGVAKACFDFALTKCNNVRIDTGSENAIMQRALIKNGFKYCGIIHLANGDPRLAYQKSIK